MSERVRIREILTGLGYNPPLDITYNRIYEWMAWYSGVVNDFHKYFVYNGLQQVPCQRHTLGMAKKVCEDWANLLLNEKVEIVTSSKKMDKQLKKVLQSNNYRVRANQLVELSFALGTGAFVEYKDINGKVLIDYIRAEMIFPLSWENGEIRECAFGSSRVDGKEEYIYVQIHRLGREDIGEDASSYYIENLYYTLDGRSKEGKTDRTVCTGSDKPLFQIIKPNICNNIDLDSPMGISVYANAIDQLKGCDLTYDSYINEFVLGKKRIIVPMSMAKIEMGRPDQKGHVIRPVFDPNDTIFYALPGEVNGNGNQKISENNMEIRAEQHELGIQRMLDSLSLKVGMGNSRYKYVSGSVKTATEVISEKSDLYQNLCKNKLILDTALRNMVGTIFFLLGSKVDIDKIGINFDDSIITDKQSEMKNDLQLVTAGIMQKWEFRVKYFRETEAQAKAAMQPTETDLFPGDE